MLHGEGYFTASDGLRLYEQWWVPASALRGRVVVVHGINEHGGRYARTAADLVRGGYAVHAMDLRGHGRSGGDRVWIRRFDEYLNDVDVMLERIVDKEPGKPVFLFGHSMGGAVAALYGIARKPSVRGLILSAPALAVAAHLFPLLRRLAPLASAVAPRLRVARMGCRFLSRDPAVVEGFKSDPLVFHGRFPIRTGAEVLRAAARIRKNAASLTLPLLILHGTSDYVSDPVGSRRLCALAGSNDKTLHLYQGLYHEVLSEPERDQVVKDLLAWLDAHR